MIQPLVLKYVFQEPEHVRGMLDALRGAQSWTCDRRSQIPCLRFVDADGERRIVAMEGAVIDARDPKSRLDGDQRTANALRVAAISCLERALLPINERQVEEAHERQKAYGLIVSTQMTGIDASEQFIVTASTPWRSATVMTFDKSGGIARPNPPVDAPHAELCPVMFSVQEGDSGSMRDMSIGLGTCNETWMPGVDMLEALRAGAMLKRPWRNR